MIIWMTGLSGAGKSTIAKGLSTALSDFERPIMILDGDEVRAGLNKDLTFSRQDRKENVRRVAEIAKLLYHSNLIVIVAIICPFEEDRLMVNELLKDCSTVNIYVKCSVRICAKRDPKGLYKKVKSGTIKEFTGISSPFEEPNVIDLVIDTEALDIDQSVNYITKYCKSNFLI